MNNLCIMGNLTADPDVTVLENEICRTNLTIAQSEGKGDKKKTVFLDCTAWRKTAELIGEHFTKGNPIILVGKLVQDNWTDKETGKPRSKLKMHVQSFSFVPRGASADAPAPTRERAPAVPAHVPAADIDSEPPF